MDKGWSGSYHSETDRIVITVYILCLLFELLPTPNVSDVQATCLTPGTICMLL